jgi:branched-chain amino acid transport system ATP-binding protein
MLAVARALMVRPKLLILDEASAGLSPKMVDMVFRQLASIRESGVTILFVEQNVRAALRLADRAYVLVDGRNRHEGRAAELRDDPAIAALYLGAAAAPAAAEAVA